MATAAYTFKHRQERHVSLTKLSVILANLALWAGVVACLAMVAR